MFPSADGHLVHWLALFGQNIAMGTVVVAVYATFNAVIDDRRKILNGAVIGLLFGLSAIISMNVPVQIYDQVRVDLRVVFVLVGSLFGGPVGAVVTTAIAGAYRFSLGGIGMPAGVAGILASGLIGYGIARLARPRNNDYGILLLLGAGLANALAAVVLVHAIFAIQRLPPLPPESEEALVLISPVVTAIFGTFMSLVHPRTWRRTERLLADIVETSSELVWELGHSGRFTFASDRYLEVLGIPAGTIIGKTPDELGWRPVDPATARSYDEAVAARKPFRSLIFVQTRKGNDPRLIAVTGVPIFTGQSRFVGYRGTASDVTEIERWRTLTARISDVVGTMVGDEFLHTLVKTLTETLGVRSGFIGRFDHAAHMARGINFYSDGAWKPRRDIAYDDLPSGAVAAGQSVIVSSGIKDRYPAMRSIRSYLGVEAYAAVPLKGPRGEVLGILGAVDDKAWDSPQYVETVLTLFAGRAAAELSRTIADEEERRRQEREAQAGKLEALGNLAGGIAHDFNNLLGAILGFGQFLVEDLENAPEQRHFAERIVGVSQRGRSLVQQILSFARSAAVEPVAVGLHEAIAEIHDLLRATLPATTQLVLDDMTEDVTILADKGQLVQVMINLCVNASDALSDEPGTVRIGMARLDRHRPELQRLPAGQTKPSPGFVETWRDAEGATMIATGALPAGDCLSLTVSDTGTGIPEAIAGQIFEPFRTTKRVGRGTGLGLAVVHRIVREHGGAILVRTEEGAGTSFEVILGGIAARATAADAVLEQRQHQAASDARASILVVDDDVDYCDMVKMALTRLGHRVDITNDPRVALGWVNHGSQHWDVLVTDQTMPYIRGHDLVRGFKAVSAATRCIICTGYSSGMSESDAINAGADAFLLKPIDVGQLGKVVGELVRAG